MSRFWCCGVGGGSRGSERAACGTPGLASGLGPAGEEGHSGPRDRTGTQEPGASSLPAVGRCCAWGARGALRRPGIGPPPACLYPHVSHLQHPAGDPAPTHRSRRAAGGLRGGRQAAASDVTFSLVLKSRDAVLCIRVSLKDEFLTLCCCHRNEKELLGDPQCFGTPSSSGKEEAQACPAASLPAAGAPSFCPPLTRRSNRPFSNRTSRLPGGLTAGGGLSSLSPGRVGSEAE